MVMEQSPAAPQFLDVTLLMERSEPRRSVLRVWQVVGMFLIVVMVSAYISSGEGEAASALNVLTFLFMLGLISTLGVISWNVVRRVRAEQQTVESIEELVRLRRWPEAGMLIEQLLSRPTRTPQGRIQGLIFLTSVLARYNRFEEAIAVQNYLLEDDRVDPGTGHGLRLARAMAMLRQDHLFDADRAINELRRQVSRAGRAMNEASANETEDADEIRDLPPVDQPQSLSAGLALVELYRDVKTGHPAEAIALFEATLPAMREQLGHRVADAHMLIAKAYDLLDRNGEAQTAYEHATLLAPPAELNRRYPETAPLANKYEPAIAPKEAA